MPTPTTDAPAGDALTRARDWGNAFDFPVVVYEWLPQAFNVVSLSLWLQLDPKATEPLIVHALVWPGTVIPLVLLGSEGVTASPRAAQPNAALASTTDAGDGR